MYIQSKFVSKCRTCGKAIQRGDVIYWTRGGGARCTACKPAPRESPDDRSTKPPVSAPDARKHIDPLDWLVIITPLGLGPALVFMDAKSAFMYFFSGPCVLAFLNGGFKPTGDLQRVKLAHRKQYKFDVQFGVICAMALLSLIPGAILWITIKYIG